MHSSRIVGAVLGLCLTLSVSTAKAEQVFVFAAASLTTALNDIADGFAAKTGHVIKPSYAASSGLAKQIDQGAPAQVFASADLKWMDYLAGRKLINPDSRFNLLGNTLVLVAPLDSRLDKVEIGPKTDFAAMAGSGRIAVGDPDAVPAGIYFKQAMDSAGQWAAVAPKLARTDSVRATLALVERGEVPLGVVYATDANVSKKTKVVGVFPGTMHEQIVYPFALVAGNESPAAKAFLDYVRSPEGKGVFVKYGFKVN